MTARRSTSRPRARRLLAGAVTLSVLGLTACGNGGGGGDAGAGGGGGGDQVVLRFSWWGSDTRHEATQRLIDAFEAENPDIRIEGDFTGWSDYWDRLATTTAGGDAPDVMQQDTRYVREYAERGALADLTPYLDDTLDTAALDPIVLPTGQVDGATYAIPAGVNAFSVIADPQIFTEAGVEVPDDDAWDWGDMIASATQVSSSTGDDVFGMQTISYNDTNFEIFARQRGESLFAEDGGIGFTRQTLVDWWTFAQDARESGAEPQASVSVETQAGGVDQSLLSTNRGSLGFWWTNELPALTAGSGRDLELLRFPGETAGEQPGMYLKASMFWSMSATSDHPDEAATFIDFLVNSPEAAGILLGERGLPVNTELREQVAPDLTDADQASAAFIEEISPGLADPPPLPPQGAGEVQSILLNINDQVLFGQLSVEEAADAFISQVETAIA